MKFSKKNAATLLLTGLMSGSVFATTPAVVENTATGDGALALGSHASATGSLATAVGRNASANALSATALGDGATVPNWGATAVGRGSSAKADNSIAVGSQAVTEGRESTALGRRSYAGAQSATALGTLANANATVATAVGNGANASAVQASALGNEAKASGTSSIAIGPRSNSSSDSAIAIGSSSTASSFSTVSIGTRSQATGGVSTAIGYASKASGINSMAMGREANATHENSVALGSYSVSKQEKSVKSATVGSITYNGFAGTSPKGTVSVGTQRRERQIVNVGAGEISATSTDAINGSQLYVTNDVINNVAGSVTTVLGGNAQVDSKGNITMSNVGGTGEATVHDAIKSQGDKIAANTKRSVANSNAIIENTKYIQAVEQKLPEVKAGDNTTVDVVVDANGKATYTVSSKDFQPAIDKVEAKADANTAKIAENAKAIAENTKGVKANAEGVKANTAKIAEVEKEAKRHTVVKAGRNVQVTKEFGENGEAVYTVGVETNHLATKAEVNQHIGAINDRIDGVEGKVAQNTKAIRKLDRDVRKNRKRADAGIASVAAMANIPQVYLPGKSGVGVGVGHKHGQSALAVGYSRTSDNAHHIIKLSAGVDSQKDVTVGAGYMYQW